MLLPIFLKRPTREQGMLQMFNSTGILPSGIQESITVQDHSERRESSNLCLWPNPANSNDETINRRFVSQGKSFVDVGTSDKESRKESEYIPGEFREVLPGQLFQRKLSFQQNQTMINLLATCPQRTSDTSKRVAADYLN